MGMKRHQHKDEIKRKVIKVSRNLFLEKGYAKTTISEITTSAGITTGSLYHFFKSKEDILLHITREVFNSAAVLADALAGEKASPWLRFSLEIGIQLHFVLEYKQVAELYLVSHESADIARMITRSSQIRNRKLFQSCCPGFDADDFYAAALAIKGIVHSFAQETVHNRQQVSSALMFLAIEMALVIFQAPGTEIEKTIQAARNLIQKCDLKLYGFIV